MRLSRLWAAAPPLVVGVAGLVLWEGAVAGFGIQEFLLPRPSSILARLGEEWGEIRHATWETGRIAVSGLLAGILLGVLLAVFTTRFRVVHEGLTPIAVRQGAGRWRRTEVRWGFGPPAGWSSRWPRRSALVRSRGGERR